MKKKTKKTPTIVHIKSCKIIQKLKLILFKSLYLHLG